MERSPELLKGMIALNTALDATKGKRITFAESEDAWAMFEASRT